MTTTTNFGITHMASSQASREVTFNEALNKLDGFLAGELVHDMASDADYTLVANEDENLTFKITDTGANLTAARNIVLPNRAIMHIAENAMGNTFDLVFKTAAGTGVTVADGVRTWIKSDGTDIEEVPGVVSDNFPFDLGFFASGTPIASAILLMYTFDRTVTFVAGLTGSQGSSNVTATSAWVGDIQRSIGGPASFSNVGTINFAASAQVATFTMASETVYNAGDVMRVLSESPADATLADIGITLKGTRL